MRTVLIKINLAYLVCSCFLAIPPHHSDAVTQWHAVSHTVSKMAEESLGMPQTLGRSLTFPQVLASG